MAHIKILKTQSEEKKICRTYSCLSADSLFVAAVFIHPQKGGSDTLPSISLQASGPAAPGALTVTASRLCPPPDMRLPERRPAVRTALAQASILAAVVLAGCGGGGGGGDDPAPLTTATVTGAVVKGAVGGAAVCAYRIEGGAQGDRLACITSASDGSFSLTVPADGTPLWFQAHAGPGRYTDELTGDEAALDADLRSAQTIVPATLATVMLTPLTELAMRRAETVPGGLTEAAINDAMALVGRAFDTGDLRRLRPLDPTVAVGLGADRNARNHGLALAAVSTLRSQLGAPSNGQVALEQVLSELELAFRPDLVASKAAAFDTALATFVASPRNRSGVTPAALPAQMRVRLATLPGAVGVLPAIEPAGPGPVVEPPPVVETGPVCVATVTPQPGSLLGQDWRLCVRPVAAGQCNEAGMAGALTLSQVFPLLATLAPTVTTYAAADACGSDINETIDLP